MFSRFPIFLFALCLTAAGVPAQDNAVCAACHDKGQKMPNTAHAALKCAECHKNHEEYPHPANIPKPVCSQCHIREGRDYARGVHGVQRAKGNEAAPDCAMCHGDPHEMPLPSSEAFRKGIPGTCGMCHSDIEQQYLVSVHGKAVARGVTQAPVCTDCHGEHSIQPPASATSTVNAQHVPATCGRCHGDVRLDRRFGLPTDVVVSFEASYHGLASQAGSQTVASCASCHGVHNILPSSDPKSTINPKNLPKTCGHCHPGAGKRFAIGPVHWVEGRAEPPAVRWIRLFYLFLIPATIGFMLLHNGGDFIRKLLRLRLRPRTGAEPAVARPRNEIQGYGSREIRMFAFERVQHALLVVSFSVLVWSGFALKYPDQWWVRPLLVGEPWLSLRGIVHRAASVLFMATAAMHAISLLASRRLRRHWKSLFPVRNDLPEIVLNTAYNLGLMSRKPRLSSHSYVEKMEYWAVVWGAVVMAATGLMLWANSLVLAWLPKAFLDIATSIHFYEALLATLAIVVWHFYTVIFDPDVYPMDTSWLTGYSVRKHEGEAPPESAEAGEKPAEHNAQ
jgi:cytochrome b subunit of formate dehydrogenase